MAEKVVFISGGPRRVVLGNETWRKAMRKVAKDQWENYLPVRERIAEGLAVEANPQWVINFKANAKRMRGRDAVEKFWGIGRGHACLLVGSGPSLNKNWEGLRMVRNHIILVAMNSNLKFLLSKGIRPDFVFATDKDEVVADHLDVGETTIPLITSSIVSPKVLDVWKGPIYHLWFDIDGIPYKKQKKMIGYKGPFPSCGSVFNLAFFCGHAVFHCSTFIMCGLDLSWKDQTHVDESLPINGFPIAKDGDSIIYTEIALYRDKAWLEETASRSNVFIINATEGGIFGLYEKGYIPGIAHMPLKQAIGVWNANRLKWEQEQKWRMNLGKAPLLRQTSFVR